MGIGRLGSQPQRQKEEQKAEQSRLQPQVGNREGTAGGVRP